MNKPILSISNVKDIGTDEILKRTEYQLIILFQKYNNGKISIQRLVKGRKVIIDELNGYFPNWIKKESLTTQGIIELIKKKINY